MNQVAEVKTVEDILEGQWDTASHTAPDEDFDVTVENNNGGFQTKVC
jgi:hypothetical protein